MDELEKRHTQQIRGREPGRRYNAGVNSRRINDIYAAHGMSKPVQRPSSAQPKSVNRTPTTAKPAMKRTARSNVLRRQIVMHAEEQKSKVRKGKIRHTLLYMFIALLLIIFLFVAWSFRDAIPFGSFKSATQQTDGTTVQEDVVETSSLSELKPSLDSNNTQIAPDAPKSLRIPKLDIQAPIRYVGSTVTGEPISTNNIHEIGWFSSAGKPRGPGVVLLNGHIRGPTQAGVFAEIGDLAPGDSLILEIGDGSVLDYTVVKVQEYSSSQINMGLAANSIEPSKAGLNLVTTLTKYSGTQKRFIIFAVL